MRKILISLLALVIANHEFRSEIEVWPKVSALRISVLIRICYILKVGKLLFLSF